MTVEKLSAWVYVDDETLIDMGLGTPEMIARDEARRAETRARWMARPVWERALIRARVWRDERRRRIDHARRALRGIECERDE